MKKMKLPVKEQYRKKEECLAEADRIIREGLIDGMDRTELAREIYFHAMMYRMCVRTGRFDWLREHADPIELADGGDTALRRFVYALTWLFARETR